ncbi:MAG: hypothetical protein KDD19_26950 [Phaeodactylibacter sp.]|nr:hypothetical protein [Phaeodactylibacter sp.]MCB9048668.1 hypothetical protein [Lewinellaceae bacterium]
MKKIKAGRIGIGQNDLVLNSILAYFVLENFVWKIYRRGYSSSVMAEKRAQNTKSAQRNITSCRKSTSSKR